MEIFLIILSAILLLLGVVGSILPVLPGLPVSYVGLIVLQLTEKVNFSTSFLVFWAVVVVLIQILDYYVPVWGTKKFGGSKFGVWGSMVGLVVGLFMGPLGIIVGPFAGALIGELLGDKSLHDALKAAFGAFVGFIVGSLAKLVAGAFMIYYYLTAVF